jgi:hypothetical protein
MKRLNKIASAFCAAALGMLALTSCEGGDLYKMDAPDWIAEKVDSIKEANTPEELVGMMDDYYPIGETDFTASFWTLGKTYVVPAGKKWNAEFTLTVNPDNKYYKNFYIVLNSADMGTEYGVIRFDNDPSKNSEWGSHIDRSLVVANFGNASGTDDIDPSVQNMNGKITLTVERQDGGIYINFTNGTLSKSYIQNTPFPDAATSSQDICCRIGVEGSFVQFLTTNIEPIGGCTSKEDKQPVSMLLKNVPSEIQQGVALEEAMKNVTAVVTYEQDVIKEVTADQLVFNSIPDISDPGKKTLVVMYAKTTNGAAANKPIMASAEFEVIPSADKMTSLVLKSAPKRTTYYLYNSDAVSDVKGRTLVFDREGLELTATYEGGYTTSYNLDSLEYSAIKAQTGAQTVTMKAKNGKTISVDINIAESAVKNHKMAEEDLGTEDCSAGWWTVFTKDVKVPAGETYQIDFTNYSSLANNWNNFVVILRNANLQEYAVLRADYYGWGAGYDGNPSLLVGGYPENWEGWNWDEWLLAMDGAKVSLYITNCNNGTADVQAVIKGTDGKTYKLYYLSITKVDPNDLNFSFTCDGSYLVF